VDKEKSIGVYMSGSNLY